MLYPIARTLTRPTEPYTLYKGVIYKFVTRKLSGGFTCYEWVKEEPWWHPLQWLEAKLRNHTDVTNKFYEEEN